MTRRVVEQLNEGVDPEEDREDPQLQGDDELEAADDDPDDESPDDEQQDDEQDGEQDDETPIGDEDEQPPVRQVGRRERAVVESRRRAQEAERRARELELEVTRLRNGGGQQRQPESEEVRRARLAAMDPNERVEFLLQEERAERQAERARDRFETYDSQDRATYNERARTNETYRKYQGEVEHRLQLLRAQGQNAPRESVLRFIIGERVLAARGTPKTNKQKKDAQRRVERERVRPSSGKGERGSRSGSQSADLEKRLENVPI